MFAGFAEPAIAEYGVDLDRELAELLSALGVEATPVLATASTASAMMSRNGAERCARPELEIMGTLPEGLVMAMAQDRQWVVDTLRRLGYEDEAEEAARVLPDPVDMEQLREFGDRYGISVAELTSRMGGSP